MAAVDPFRPGRSILLLQAARRREIDVVLVWRLDRWGRSVTDLLATLQELEHLGVGLVSLWSGFLQRSADDPATGPCPARIPRPASSRGAFLPTVLSYANRGILCTGFRRFCHHTKNIGRECASAVG
ncbi:MAG: recombinase family protein [Candidatus Solibacter sp.]